MFIPGERIVFTRTVPGDAGVPVPQDIESDCKALGIEPGWRAHNLCADWGQSLASGLLGRRHVAEHACELYKHDPVAVDFLEAAIEGIDAVLMLAARYAEAALHEGFDDIAARLQRVPAGKPDSFHDALQSLRLMHAAVWMSDSMHVGLGRFDQYMWPYLKDDLDRGALNMEEAESLLAEFFIGLNKDSDLYPGQQQGDNGQSLILGGVTPEGAPAVNELTWMVLRAAQDVRMIDPKINLRISADTDLGLLKEGSRLTRLSLGFPQYANDDVVIPALASHGYALEDARDYTVAACWEFIVPGRGMDVPNVHALNFPHAVDKAIRDSLACGDSFQEILSRTRENIRGQVQLYVNHWRAKKHWPPSAYYSALMTDCLERGKDISAGGATYYNFGIHGAGSANAADALAAVKRFVFDQGRFTGCELLEALETNFEHAEELRRTLLHEGPKVGNNDAEANELLRFLFDSFADVCEAVPDNGRGGIIRPGTGSAMYYVWLVDGSGNRLEPTVLASADGRRIGEPISCSLAPSIGVKVNGPISVLQSFSVIDYQRIYNGGPITLELSDTVFRNEDSLEKVAMLVRTFARLGCQQLQLNTVNVETLKDAKLHPENHQNLVVRVWGWSGYFCELDEPYQDHVIARHAYAL